MTQHPTIVACAHGTVDRRGRAAVGSLVAAARRLAAPGQAVRAAYVDVHPPLPERVLSSLPAGPVVLVPLLLSRGYHARVDVSGAAAVRPGTAVAAPLGAGDEVIDIVAARCREAAGEPRPGDRVILAAAGSSDPRVVAEITQAAEAFTRRTGWHAHAAYLRAAQPGLGEAVRAARQDRAAGRVIVATYLLAPGVLADKLARGALDSGADVVTPPLLGARPDEATVQLAQVVLARSRVAAPDTRFR